MIKINFQQKNRAEHGAIISEEKQTLLSKRREKISLNFAKQDFISNSGYLIANHLINFLINDISSTDLKGLVT
jgi:hypothetical protein